MLGYAVLVIVFIMAILFAGYFALGIADLTEEELKSLKEGKVYEDID